MFCPQCRAEYRKGFYKCSDCDIPLVDQLPADRPVTDRQAGSETDHPQLVVLRTFSHGYRGRSCKERLGVRWNRFDGQKRQQGRLAFSRGVALLVRTDDATAANDMLGIEGLDSSKKTIHRAGVGECPGPARALTS